VMAVIRPVSVVELGGAWRPASTCRSSRGSFATCAACPPTERRHPGVPRFTRCSGGDQALPGRRRTPSITVARSAARPFARLRLCSLHASNHARGEHQCLERQRPRFVEANRPAFYGPHRPVFWGST